VFVHFLLLNKLLFVIHRTPAFLRRGQDNTRKQKDILHPHQVQNTLIKCKKRPLVKLIRLSFECDVNETTSINLINAWMWCKRDKSSYKDNIYMVFQNLFGW